MPRSGGAAALRSLESPPVRKSAAVDADHGSDDSGSRAASQEAALSEEEQAADRKSVV